MEELQAGDPLRMGPYLLLARLGTGGMGQVFLGRSPGGRLVAVKVIRVELALDPAFRARFVREVAAARRVGGIFTAPVVDADPTAPLPWLVTGYVNGPSLAEAVAGYGVLPVASVLSLAAGLAEGLSAVHAAGVVHRDLKPSNVLLAPDGPRVIDFGISQAVGATHLTRTGMVVGSPSFMSPEQAEGTAVGRASDVFSLGAVLVFAATGEGPFGSGAPTAQLYKVVYGAPQLDRLPGPVRPLVERCMDRDPARRPTAEQFLAELTAAHPSAADLTDWLPASILASAAVPRLAGAPSGPAVPNVAGEVTLTSPADQYRPGPAGPASPGGRQVPPGPAAQVPGAPGPPPISAVAPGPAPGSDRPTVVAGSPLPPVTAAGPSAGNRRRRRVISVIAAVAVLGAVALIIAAPWKGPPPVLRPTGLTVDSATSSSVAFRWSGPATGPVPDRYEIVRDGHVVGSVPGTITDYQDAGLAPDTSYRFQVIAIRDSQHSPRSLVLTLKTLTPPVSAAVLAGTWTANYKTTSVNQYESWSIARVGATWTDSWKFAPGCSSGPCDVTLTGNFNGTAFTASLTRAGAVYTGTAPLDDYNYCGRPSNYIHDTLHVQIQVQGADVRGPKWAATSWSGTITLFSPYDPNGNCATVTIKANVLGSG